jgi:UDP-glucose 4-epimerase
MTPIRRDSGWRRRNSWIRELTGWQPRHDDLEFVIRTAWEWERKQ